MPSRRTEINPIQQASEIGFSGNGFWAFVYHDAHAPGIMGVDLAYCITHGILKRKSPATRPITR